MGKELAQRRGKTVTNSFFFITKARHSQDAGDVQVILAVLYETKCWRSAQWQNASLLGCSRINPSTQKSK